MHRRRSKRPPADTLCIPPEISPGQPAIGWACSRKRSLDDEYAQEHEDQPRDGRTWRGAAGSETGTVCLFNCSMRSSIMARENSRLARLTISCSHTMQAQRIATSEAIEIRPIPEIRASIIPLIGAV